MKPKSPTITSPDWRINKWEVISTLRIEQAHNTTETRDAYGNSKLAGDKYKVHKLHQGGDILVQIGEDIKAHRNSSVIRISSNRVASQCAILWLRHRGGSAVITEWNAHMSCVFLLCNRRRVQTLSALFFVPPPPPLPPPPPKGGRGFLMSPPSSRFGISGLSVWSHFSIISSLVTVLLPSPLALSVLFFSAFGPFSWPLFP